MAKTISISDENHKYLTNLCKKNQKYDSVISELIEKEKKRNEIL